MYGEATIAVAAAVSLRPTSHYEPIPHRAPCSSQRARARMRAEDERLRDAVRALIAAIDALP